MPIRTNAAAVRGIIELEDTITLEPFIATASALVDEVCVPSGYDDTRLELIERWLSAHFAAILAPRTANERAGPVGESYQYQVGLGLTVTTYGQQAMMLDTKGGLGRLSKQIIDGKLQPPPGVYYGGTPPDNTPQRFIFSAG